jgi:DNA-binding NarL/FixJ family response regulator
MPANACFRVATGSVPRHYPEAAGNPSLPDVTGSQTLPNVVILDNRSVAESLAIALRATVGLDVAWADSLDGLGPLLAAGQPTVLIVDIGSDNAAERLGVMDLDAVGTNGVRVLFLARHDHGVLAEAVRRRGAAGFLPKAAPLQALASAVDRISSGEDVFDDGAGQTRAGRRAWPSVRELQLLDALGRGMTNAAIAERLQISPRTVESHLRRLFSRYDVASRSQLLMLAVREGWIAAGETRPPGG